MADLGPGDDRFVVKGSLVAVGSVRVNGGEGDDVIRGGPEDDLLQAGPGADKPLRRRGRRRPGRRPPRPDLPLRRPER